jgi:hypothetical protein
MKKISLLPLFALVMAVAASAFTLKENQRAKKAVPSGQAYFVFMGTQASQENQATNWERVESPANLCSEGENLLCTILAPIADPEDEHPDFTGISNVRTSPSISESVYKP